MINLKKPLIVPHFTWKSMVTNLKRPGQKMTQTMKGSGQCWPSKRGNIGLKPTFSFLPLSLIWLYPSHQQHMLLRPQQNSSKPQNYFKIFLKKAYFSVQETKQQGSLEEKPFPRPKGQKSEAKEAKKAFPRLLLHPWDSTTSNHFQENLAFIEVKIWQPPPWSPPLDALPKCVTKIIGPFFKLRRHPSFQPRVRLANLSCFPQWLTQFPNFQVIELHYFVSPDFSKKRKN